MRDIKSESKIVMLIKISIIDLQCQKNYTLITRVIKLVKLMRSVESLFCINLFYNAYMKRNMKFTYSSQPYCYTFSL